MPRLDISKSFLETMEVNAQPDVIKYSKLLEQDAKDKINTEKLVLEGIANNNYPSNVKIEDFEVDLNLKFKGKQRKLGFKPWLDWF